MLRTLWQTLFHRRPAWKLIGYDTFAGEWYDLSGSYPSEASARRAAQRQLCKLEKLQPSAQSGGQSGIQDQIYIVRPDGSHYRYNPD